MARSVVNKKMTRSFRVPDSFFIGAQVAKRFSGQWYLGKVTEVLVDEKDTLWQIIYEDFDASQMDKQELAQALAYHPLLNTAGDLLVPEVGSFVWFSENQAPKLGRVREVDPTNSRPVVLQRYAPQSNATRLHLARFQAEHAKETGEPEVTRITPHQIIFKVKQLTTRGFLAAADRRKLASCLTR